MPGPLALVLASALFSTAGAVIKLCSLAAPQIACLRSAVAAVTLFVVLPEARRGWRLRELLPALPYAATMVLFALATKLGSAAAAIFLQSTAPLYLAFLAPWLLGEPLRRHDLVVMAAMLAGLALLAAGEASAAGPSESALVPFLGAASGLSWALTVLGLRWLATGGSGGPGGAAGSVPGPTLVAGNILASLVTLPLALPIVSISAADAVAVLWLGSAQIALAYILLARGLRQVPALPAALLMLLEPVLNPLGAWLVLGETPRPGVIAGGAVVVAAAAWYARATAALTPATAAAAPPAS